MAMRQVSSDGKLDVDAMYECPDEDYQVTDGRTNLSSTTAPRLFTRRFLGFICGAIGRGGGGAARREADAGTRGAGNAGKSVVLG